ncbi:hypothetical protein [Halobaculum sp. EA56]|uniref:hypothetical protein n=1 Tax=Halobaculum sp. EA56 TaxID=3421648 RepID=UPI003EBB0054
MTIGERLPHEPEEVVCFGCGRYTSTRRTERIDVSREDEYYPKVRHLCPDCQGPDEDDADRGGSVDTDGGTVDVEDVGEPAGKGTPMGDASADGGKEARVVTLTDEQIEALANRKLAIVKTDDHILGLIHADRAREAQQAAATLADARDAEFDVTEVTERA